MLITQNNKNVSLVTDNTECQLILKRTFNNYNTSNDFVYYEQDYIRQHRHSSKLTSWKIYQICSSSTDRTENAQHIVKKVETKTK